MLRQWISRKYGDQRKADRRALNDAFVIRHRRNRRPVVLGRGLARGFVSDGRINRVVGARPVWALTRGFASGGQLLEAYFRWPTYGFPAANACINLDASLRMAAFINTVTQKFNNDASVN